jgi:hypothetical protein
MKKSVLTRRSLFFILPVFVVMLIAIPAHAQYDDCNDPKTCNQVQDVTYVTGGCDSNMTADQCFSAGGMANGTCQSNQCAKCSMVGHWQGPFWVVNDKCQPASEPGSCKCTIDVNKAGCTLQGTCYYHQ